MSKNYASGLKAVACLVGLTVASAALAQAPRSSVDAAASSGLPEFRDPKTGQIWTPDNVGGGGKPTDAASRAFDPLAQAVVVRGVVDQNVSVKGVGTVPVTAGPTVPLVTIDAVSLGVLPGQRWQAVLYLNNNSTFTMASIVGCRFTNAGNLVQETRGLLPPVGSGQRVGFSVYGPKSDIFVDHVYCRVIEP